VPTYEYMCADCKRRFDVFQSFSEESLTTCEVCGGSLKKVFGSVGIMFKGSGFYKTDSRPAASSES
jgi:putative FmdB family regulatory protein